MEERVKPNELTDDGGASGGEIGVADVREIFPHRCHVPGVGIGFSAQYGQVGVAEQSAVLVTWLGPVVGGQPDQSRDLGGLLRGKPGVP